MRKPTIRAGERIIARGASGKAKPANGNLARLLGTIGVSKAVAAAYLGVPPSRLDEDPGLAAEWTRGRAEGDVQIASDLLRASKRGNVTASIFLAKARLGWSDHASAASSTVGFLVETRPKAASPESWASEYGPMQSPPKSGDAPAGQEE